MKKKILRSIFIIGSLLWLLISCTTMLAQTTDYEKLIEEELTEAQKELLATERELMKADRNALKASLTEEQLAILKDKSLSKNEIRKRLSKSFSKNQRELIELQQRRLRDTREAFRQTLTDEQRKLFQDRLDRKVRDSRDRDALRRDRPRDSDRPDGSTDKPGDGI